MTVKDVLFHRMWSSDGIRTSRLENGRIKCSVSHFTSFAVLVSPTQQEVEKALVFISYIGCAVSIVCLILAIVIMSIFRYCNELIIRLPVTLLSLGSLCRKQLNKGVLLYVHLNLSVSLLLALVVFVCGVDTAKENRVGWFAQ